MFMTGRIPGATAVERKAGAVAQPHRPSEKTSAAASEPPTVRRPACLRLVAGLGRAVFMPHFVTQSSARGLIDKNARTIVRLNDVSARTRRGSLPEAHDVPALRADRYGHGGGGTADDFAARFGQPFVERLADQIEKLAAHDHVLESS